jgi:DNA transposition AAA+ family ATPase
LKSVFIETSNSQTVRRIIDDLLGHPVGMELAVSHGPAGRGKSTIAERIVTTIPQAVYVYFEPRLTVSGLVREISFKIAGARHGRSEKCMIAIEEALAQERKLVIIDEVDQAGLKHLNQVRALHDLLKIPFLLMGESSLLGKLARERRLQSRVRQVHGFSPVTGADILAFYDRSLSLDLEADQVKHLARHGKGDFRAVLADALRVERIMRASGLSTITDSVIKEICG